MNADLNLNSERWEAEPQATSSAVMDLDDNGISLRDSDGIVRKSNILDSSASGFNSETTASGYFAV
jgi:hypothetical protein